jgi:hypothetical protein
VPPALPRQLPEAAAVEAVAVRALRPAPVVVVAVPAPRPAPVVVVGLQALQWLQPAAAAV